ncbi:hypothetical protein GFY24_40495 [Nocardia sp. SYP-A9097]|uniref:hypothetical protein n=1 Tax=Nocardia sp. SYP-A9097 TaxID=2663237 RepID=UPI00129B6DD3|nr:hypothetical protein [Nocardia sp. SYP-A9097]MRH93604.1 hypothetical protein [Nocardia sp. SYP-A9097]
MAISVTRTLDVGEVGEAASTQRHPVEWWYVNAMLDAPGTPIDGMTLVVAFSKFAGVIEEGRHVIVSPDGGIFADFGTGPLTEGTIRGDSQRLDVRNGRNYLRGGYPDYELHVEGEAASGAYISASLNYVADAEPEREGYIDSQFRHWVLYRARAEGSITIGSNTYPVRGLGYIEHLFGTLGWLEPYLGEPNPPHFVNGWNWYWSPAAGPSELIVQAGGFITEGEPVPFVSVSADRKTYEHFITGTFQTLETRRVDGVPHAHKFRLTDSNEAGSVDLTFTRRDAAQRAVKQAPGGNKVVFVTGYTELEGTVTLGDTTYDVTGRAFGSVFTVSLSPVLVQARNLPPAIRVPLGRTLRLVRQLAGRGN